MILAGNLPVVEPSSTGGGLRGFRVPESGFAGARAARLRGHRQVVLIVLVLSLVIGALLRFGGYLVVGPDSLPKHTQVVVVLGGSLAAETARREEGMRLIREGLGDRVMLGVPKLGYWGQNVPEIARQYLATAYGPEEARRVVFCEMPEGVDSTEEEAKVFRDCLARRAWRSVLS